jgi:hypothetical protein
MPQEPSAIAAQPTTTAAGASVGPESRGRGESSTSPSSAGGAAATSHARRRAVGSPSVGECDAGDTPGPLWATLFATGIGVASIARITIEPPSVGASSPHVWRTTPRRSVEGRESTSLTGSATESHRLRRRERLADRYAAAATPAPTTASQKTRRARLPSCSPWSPGHVGLSTGARDSNRRRRWSM